MDIKKFLILILFFLTAVNLNFAQTKTMNYYGTQRTYKVHLPTSYSTTKSYALVLVFNAWTHTPDVTETHTKMSLKADSAGFIVVYPAGICGTNFQWNHDDRFKVDDAGFVTELIDTLIKDYSIDTKRIYASGFSNGAAMAYRMAYELPDRIAAIAPVGQAFSSKKLSPKRATPTIHFHAKNDGIVSYASVKPVIDYWKTLNKNITGPDTFFVTSGANGVRWKGDESTEFIFYTTDIGGHSWPGGNPSFATPSQAISANDLLWDFFNAHPNSNKVYTTFDSTFFDKIFTKMEKYAGMGSWNAVSSFYQDSAFILESAKTIRGRQDIDKYWNSSSSAALELTCRIVSKSLEGIYNSSFYKNIKNKPAAWNNLQIDTANTYYVAGTMVHNKLTYNFINVWQKQSNGFWKILVNSSIPAFNYSETKTMQHDAVKRTYKVHLPPKYNTKDHFPLVMVFNGWTHTPDNTENHTKMSIKADSANFVVVYPAGIAGSNKEWNHDDRYSIDDVGFIKELIDSLIQDYSIDTNKIYASGFSNGAGMAYRMAYELPNRIAAIAPVAGTLVGTKYNPVRATPTIHFDAKNDGSAYAAIKPQVEYWQTLNNNITGPDTFFVVSGATGVRWKGDKNSEFVLYVTDIGGHSWPGGNPSFATPSQAISADDLLWDFFMAHTLNASATDVKKNIKSDMNYELLQNYPNPFNPTTVISYQLPVTGNVQLKVYDMLGKEVAVLVNKEQNAGSYQVQFDAGKLSSGMYLYVLKVGSFVQTRKMMLLK